MLTLLGYLLLAIVLVAALFFLGVTLLPAGEQLAPAVRDEPHWAVQNGRPVSAEDIENVRLPVALRGYRFAETDELLDTLADQIRWRDTELARLRAALSRLSESAETVAPVPQPAQTTDWTRPAPGPHRPDEPGDDHSVENSENNAVDNPADSVGDNADDAAVREHAQSQPSAE